MDRLFLRTRKRYVKAGVKWTAVQHRLALTFLMSPLFLGLPDLLQAAVFSDSVMISQSSEEV